MQQRIVCLVLFDFGFWQIRRGDIRSRMPIKPYHPQMQECWLFSRPDIGRSLLCHRKRIIDIQPICLKVLNAGAMFHRCCNPTLGRFGRNPYPVVFTHKQQRQRGRLNRRPTRRIYSSLRSCMVCRRIPKRTHRDPVDWQLSMFWWMTLRKPKRVCSTNGFGQMARDG